MTPAEATDFAARITSTIDASSDGHDTSDERADRVRVARDLKGYLRALDGLAAHRGEGGDCLHENADHCPDAARYTAYRDDVVAALILTGSLYGVTP